MKSKELVPDRVIAVKLPSQLATDLRAVALRESNRDSTVVCRILAAGLQRELHRKSQTSEEDAG